uniref:EGF-like calcium-binding domain-containing protein n=1 Tax=Pelodiscus sinensis TaxID=13735 RepID=K7F2Q9_PELSI
QGLERTARESFGGGNTAWEEEKLAKYAHSETRLLEVLESVCDKSDFACHQLLEQSEEHVESWWFQGQQQHPDFFQWLCMDTLKVCCPPGAYGPDCLRESPAWPCRQAGPGRGLQGEGQAVPRPVSQHGPCPARLGRAGVPGCEGLGHAAGSGPVSPFLAECYRACGRSSGPEDSSCLRCKRGWVARAHGPALALSSVTGHLNRRGANGTFLSGWGRGNEAGVGLGCGAAVGPGHGQRIWAAVGLGHGVGDVDECASAPEPVCTGPQEVCENTDGSYRCVCAEGHVRKDGECVEDKPPDTPAKGFFEEVTEDEVVVLQQMFFGVVICALATLAAKGDMVFTAIFIGAVAALAGLPVSARGLLPLQSCLSGS